MDEIILSGTSLIDHVITEGSIGVQGQRIKQFTQSVKDMLVDGVDYGMIPKVDKPCLFKSGGEKIQYLLGLTPQYTLIERVYEPVKKEKNDKGEWVVIQDAYYRYEYNCCLYYGEIKVAEGVGNANTREYKYRSQERIERFADDFSNTVMKIAKKRAFMDAILAVACISDMFTQDLEDNETVKSLKVDKKTKVGKVTTDNVKSLAAEAWAGKVSDEELTAIIAEVNPKYKKLTDIDKSDYQVVFDLVHAKRKENNKKMKEQKGENDDDKN